MPSSNDFLNISSKGDIIQWLVSFKNLGCILSGPCDLFCFKALMIFEIVPYLFSCPLGLNCSCTPRIQVSDHFL